MQQYGRNSLFSRRLIQDGDEEEDGIYPKKMTEPVLMEGEAGTAAVHHKCEA